jgi:heme a synthase
MGKLEVARANAVERDQAEQDLGRPVNGRIVSAVRAMAHWPSGKVRVVISVLTLCLLVSSAVGRAGADVASVKYSASTVNTLSIMGLAIVILGRWVRVSPKVFRRIAFASAVVLGFIILTGAAVRLTGSGLGCVDWPTCNNGKVVPELDDYHGKIEFGNRIVTGLCVLFAGIGVLASFVRVPYRKDLVQVGGLVVVAIMGNAVLGGLTVLNELRPEYVMGHFLLAIVALALGLLLFHRAGEAAPSHLLGTGRPPVLGSQGQLVGRLLTVAALLTVILGCLVTGSGPHGGDEDVARFGLNMTSVMKVHSASAWVTIGFALLLTRLAWTSTVRGSAAVRQRCQLLVLVLAAQGGIGYLQWFTQVPAKLVMLHVLGAVCVWTAVLWVRAALTTAVPASVGPAAALHNGDFGRIPAATS